MDCKNCKDNYLYAIFESCLKGCLTEEGLSKFDRICYRSGDPRSPLTISISMYRNECDECKKYRTYYEDYLKRMGL